MSQRKPDKGKTRYAHTEPEAIRRGDEWLQFYSKQNEAYKRLYGPTANLIADLLSFLRSKPTPQEDDEEILRSG